MRSTEYTSSFMLFFFVFIYNFIIAIGAGCEEGQAPVPTSSHNFIALAVIKTSVSKRLLQRNVVNRSEVLYFGICLIAMSNRC